MCITETPHHIWWPPPCHPHANWRPVNQGVTTPRRLTVIVACARCGTEWSIVATAERLIKPHDRRTPAADTDNRYRSAAELVAGGATITDACRTAGIDRSSYTRRTNGRTRSSR